MYGNGRYSPGLLVNDPRDTVRNLQSYWPVCPYWDAASTGISSPAHPGSPNLVHVTRATCVPICGDGFIDFHPFGTEECDGENLAGTTCQDEGFDAGVLACDASCSFDTSACFNFPPPPPPPPLPEAGGCSVIDESTCADWSDDGCYPDGPGSFGLSQIDSTAFDQISGFYCPDDDGTAVCGLSNASGALEPACFECPDPGEGHGDAAYGCPCVSDDDCENQGWGLTKSIPNGVQVELACYGSTDQGWGDSLGTCLPAIDPLEPQTQTEGSGSIIDEFERTRWLCKQTCDALEDTTLVDYACVFRQGSHDFTYATCIDTAGCKDGAVSLTGGECEANGGSCNPDTNQCVDQCDPTAPLDPAIAGCAAYGYPGEYSCATGWAAEGLCVPPECANDPIGAGLDLSACMMFVGADWP